MSALTNRILGWALITVSAVLLVLNLVGVFAPNDDRDRLGVRLG